MRIPRLALPVAAALVAGVGLVPVVAAQSAQASTYSDCWQTNEQYVTALSQAALNRYWGGPPIATQRAALDSRTRGAQRATYAKTDLVNILFHSAEYVSRARTDAQIVRDVIQGVVHRAPTQADYDATLWKMRDATTVPAKVAHVRSAINAEADTKLGKLCTAAEAVPVPPAYTIGPDVDAKKCWQTNQQFATALIRATHVWQNFAPLTVQMLDSKTFGAQRAQAVKDELVAPYFTEGDYDARNRSDKQMVRDMIEALLHRAPTAAEFTTLASQMATQTTLAGKTARVMTAINTELTGKLSRLCSAAEANPAPATYVIGSDVTTDGQYLHPYDTVDVKYRSEVRAVRNTDARVSNWSFYGQEPTLETEFTLTGITAAGNAAVADIKIGTRLAAQPEAAEGSTAAAPSIMVEVLDMTGTGNARTVSGRVLALPELIRSGSLNLTGAVNAAIPAAVTRVMQNDALSRSPEDVGSFYKENGDLVSASDAGPGFAGSALSPSVWFSTTPEGSLCMNAANLGLEVSVADSSKTQADAAAKAQAIRDRVEVAKWPNGAARGDFKVTAGASAKLDEIQGCTRFSAQNWSVTKDKVAGQITQTSSSKVHVTAALDVTGTAEIAGTWKILEEEIFIPVPIPFTPIVIPTHLKPSAFIPFSANLTGTANLTYAYGNQVEDQVTRSTIDTSTFPFITQINTPGARSDYGAQTKGATGTITGTIKATVAPAVAWTFGSWGSKVTIGQKAKITPNMPAWMKEKPDSANDGNINPFADGLVKLSVALAVPELVATIAASTAPPCKVTYTPAFNLKADIKLSAGEGFFKLLGIPPPTAHLPLAFNAYTGAPETLWTNSDCESEPPCVEMVCIGYEDPKKPVTTEPADWPGFGTWRITSTRDYKLADGRTNKITCRVFRKGHFVGLNIETIVVDTELVRGVNLLYTLVGPTGYPTPLSDTEGWTSGRTYNDGASSKIVIEGMSYLGPDAPLQPKECVETGWN